MSIVLVIGEAFVDFLPQEVGKLRSVGGFEMHGGGAPCNVARGVSRLGVPSRFVSVLGDDEFGDFVLEQLKRDQVDSRFVRRLKGGRTQLCFVTLDSTGDRHFNGRGPDASLGLGVQDMTNLVFKDVSSLVITCGSLRTRQGVFAIERALQYMNNQSNGWVCCDPGVCPPEWCPSDVMRRRLWGVFSRSEIVKCADHETYWLTGEDDPIKAAKAFIQGGAKCSIVTRGAQGAVWVRRVHSNQYEIIEIDSPLVHVIDTTGAGDAFLSALIARLTSEQSMPSTLALHVWKKHLEFAALVGALGVTIKGAVHGVPRLETQKQLQNDEYFEDLRAKAQFPST